MINSATEKTVTFETKCYEQDWKYILKDGYLKENIENCQHNFAKKILYLNNFSNYKPAKRRADKLVAMGIIDEYHVVADYALDTLSHFDLKMEDFNGGYHYSIAEMVSIFLAKTDYILHFSGDSRLRESSNRMWIAKAIQMMETDQKILVANPMWNHDYAEAASESLSENDEWFYSFGFSDQCYLVKTQEFKKPILKFSHPDSERYPEYGGELFEKRVDAYMRTNGLLRITNKHCSYVHENFPKNSQSKISKILNKIMHTISK